MPESLSKIEIGENVLMTEALDRRRRLECERLTLLRRQEQEAVQSPTAVSETGRSGFAAGPATWWRRLEQDRLALQTTARAAGAFPGPGAEEAVSAGGATSAVGGNLVKDITDGVKIAKDRAALWGSCAGLIDIPLVLVGVALHKAAFDGKIKKAAAAIKNAANQTAGGEAPGPGAMEGAAGESLLSQIPASIKKQAEGLAAKINWILLGEWLVVLLASMAMAIAVVFPFVVVSVLIYVALNPDVLASVLGGSLVDTVTKAFSLTAS